MKRQVGIISVKLAIEQELDFKFIE